MAILAYLTQNLLPIVWKMEEITNDQVITGLIAICIFIGIAKGVFGINPGGDSSGSNSNNNNSGNNRKQH